MSNQKASKLLEQVAQLVEGHTAPEPVTVVAKPTAEMRWPIMPISEWIRDPYYIGDLNDFLYDYWRNGAEQAFGNRGKTEIVVTGSAGIGKSLFAELCWLRFLYELSCYNSVQRAFGMPDTSTIYMAYLCVSMRQAELAGFGNFRNLVDSVPYFRREFPRNRKSSILEFPGGIKIISGSDEIHTIGTNLISVIVDEANFFKKGAGNPGDVDKVMSIYASARTRIRSRFLKKDTAFPGLSILVSSVSNRSSFTEKIIAENNADTMVFSGALWDVKPKGTYSDETFLFFIGNEFYNAQVVESVDDLRLIFGASIPSGELEAVYTNLPQSIKSLLIRVPVNFKDEFRRYPLQALTDLAGVSSAPKGKLFTSRAHLHRCESDELSHPFTKEEISVSMSDAHQIIEYIIPGAMFKDGRPLRHPTAPRFIHIDQSVSCDSTGVACCVAEGSLVATDAGLLPIERLEGRVFDGVAFQPFVLLDRGVKPLVEVELFSGVKLSLTADHRVQVLDKSAVKEKTWKEAGLLRVRDRVLVMLGGAVAKPPLEVGGFLLDDNLAWILGYLQGDGCVDDSRISFCVVNNEEKEAVVSRMECFGVEPRFDEQPLRSNSTVRVVKICYNSRKLVRDFSEAFGVQFRGVNKRVPPAIFSSSKSVIESFLMGWLEADGTVTKRGDVCGFTAVEEFSRQVLQLSRYVGVGTRRNSCFGICGVRGYFIRFERAPWMVFSNFKKQSRLMSSRGKCRFPRYKFMKSVNGKRFWEVDESLLIDKVRRVRSVAPGRVFDVGLAGAPHSFVAESVVVHNCHVADVISSPNGTVPLVEFDFMLRINPPPPPDKIAIDKCRRFIQDLRIKGLPIGRVTMDQYQSTTSLQALTISGINAAYLSVDRDDSWWLMLIDYIYNMQVVMYNYQPFVSEFLALNHDRQRRKVDHPDKNEDGSVGRKDVSDAVVGAFAGAVNGFQTDSTPQERIDTMAQMVEILAPACGGNEGSMFPEFVGMKVGRSVLNLNRFMEAHKRMLR